MGSRTDAQLLAELIGKSLAKATSDNYNRTWRKLAEYRTIHLKEPWSLPVSENSLALFLTHLHKSGYAYNTLKLHNSAVSYIHKLKNLTDPTKSFSVACLMLAIRKEAPKTLEQLSISKNMLHELLGHLDDIVASKYDRCLYRAVLLLQYHTCARIGEMVLSGENNLNVLRIEQIHVQGHSQMVVDFVYFKHGISAAALTISAEAFHCPIQAVRSYMQLRGRKPGPLFKHSGGNCVTRDDVSEILKNLLVAAGFNPDRYDTHSLRAGRASQAAADGWTETQIQRLGRWKSQAYKKYIKGPINTSAKFR